MLQAQRLCLSSMAGQSMGNSFDYVMRQRRDFDFLHLVAWCRTQFYHHHRKQRLHRAGVLWIVPKQSSELCSGWAIELKYSVDNSKGRTCVGRVYCRHSLVAGGGLVWGGVYAEPVYGFHRFSPAYGPFCQEVSLHYLDARKIEFLMVGYHGAPAVKKSYTGLGQTPRIFPER
jgi:hypothetical protein